MCHVSFLERCYVSCFKGKEGGAEFMEKVLKGTQAGKKKW